MPYLLNVLYGSALLLLSPWLFYRAIATRRYRRGLWAKLTGQVSLPPRSPHARHRIWFHGVSVGEIDMLRHVVDAVRARHPDWECVVSTTTETGFDVACKRFADLPVFFWPFDFSWAVRRAIRKVQPSLVVLAEGEIWPNFLSAAQRESVPVAVVNGRMSPRSQARYRWLAPLVRRVFKDIALFAVQTEEYAVGYRRLVADPADVIVTGNVKYDGVSGDRTNARTEKLARLLSVQPNDLVWIAGSTQAPEEQASLDIYRRVKPAHSRVRLFVVPRHPERFDEVARLLEQSGQSWVRRSALTAPLSDRDAVVLVDSMGELDALWGLADIAFVGGSLDGRRGGQNMLQPAAYGAAVIFGPHVWNFKDATTRLLQANGAIQVSDTAALEAAVDRLCADQPERQRLGQVARRLVREQQGATACTVELLERLLMQKAARRRVA